MSPDSLPIKLRQARGAMSLADAASMSQIPEDRIRMYEEGERRPYGKTLRRLADIYGMRVAELLGQGRVVRRRGRPPEPSRRRRRIMEGESGGSIDLPLEVAEGQTIRLVIELVVRRRGELGVEVEARPELQEVAVGGSTLTEVPEVPAALTHEAPLAARGIRHPRSLEDPLRPRDSFLELKRAYRDFRHKKP